MKSKNQILAKEWILKADKDLEVSGILLKKRSRYLDVASFHCQQAFEKYLKSTIVNNGIVPEKTHLLENLLNKVLEYDLRFVKWMDAAREISPYAIIPRYPDEKFDITTPKLRKLIKKTDELGNLVKEIVRTNLKKI